MLIFDVDFQCFFFFSFLFFRLYFFKIFFVLKLFFFLFFYFLICQQIFFYFILLIFITILFFLPFFYFDWLYFSFFPFFIIFSSKTYIFYYDNAGPPYTLDYLCVCQVFLDRSPGQSITNRKTRKEWACNISCSVRYQLLKRKEPGKK